MDNRERVDVLIRNGCVITVDLQRSVIVRSYLYPWDGKMSHWP
ncbi:hypothetical protein B0G75_1166 [Paraburkholderia sp. BL18I3N2]|nr:hypothetical protein B0G75_1166 [Paraburkholderia sp. BL18I3N2]